MGEKSMRKPEKQKKPRERIYAALLCICTMLSLVSVERAAINIPGSVIRGWKNVSMNIRRNVIRRRR